MRPLWFTVIVAIVGVYLISTSLTGMVVLKNCVDADGTNRFVAGTLQRGTQQFNDACVIGNKYVKEYGCTKNDKPFVELLHCPAGCENGACKNQSPSKSVSCTDSDNNNVYAKGKLTFGSQTKEDVCMISNKYVKEFGCRQQKQPFVELDYCENGCVDGACLACVPGQTKCEGTVQRQCVQGLWGKGSITAGVCGAVCNAGETKCEGNTFFSCKKGTWSDGTITIGKCNSECEDGQKKCEFQKQYVCKNNHWSNGTASTACGALCNPAEQKCSGTMLAVCTSEGQWQYTPAKECGAECTQGEKKCFGTVQKVCQPGGVFNSGHLAKECGAECTPGQTSCEGTHRRTCEQGKWKDIGEWQGFCNAKKTSFLMDGKTFVEERYDCGPNPPIREGGVKGYVAQRSPEQGGSLMPRILTLDEYTQSPGTAYPKIVWTTGRLRTSKHVEYKGVSGPNFDVIDRIMFVNGKLAYVGGNINSAPSGYSVVFDGKVSKPYYAVFSFTNINGDLAYLAHEDRKSVIAQQVKLVFKGQEIGTFPTSTHLFNMKGKLAYFVYKGETWVADLFVDGQKKAAYPGGVFYAVQVGDDVAFLTYENGKGVIHYGEKTYEPSGRVESIIEVSGKVGYVMKNNSNNKRFFVVPGIGSIEITGNSTVRTQDYFVAHNKIGYVRTTEMRSPYGGYFTMGNPEIVLNNKTWRVYPGEYRHSLKFYETKDKRLVYTYRFPQINRGITCLAVYESSA